jgi:hypothetical protein
MTGVTDPIGKNRCAKPGGQRQSTIVARACAMICRGAGLSRTQRRQESEHRRHHRESGSRWRTFVSENQWHLTPRRNLEWEHAADMMRDEHEYNYNHPSPPRYESPITADNALYEMHLVDNS